MSEENSQENADQATIRKLLELKKRSDISQYQTYLAKKAARQDLSGAEMRDFERLGRELTAELTGSGDKFKNILAVLHHLQGQGYKISQTHIYRAKDAGELKESPDGTYTMAEVLRYAASLKRIGSRSAMTVALEKMQEDRLTQETRRIRNMADLSEFKTELLRQRYIPREQHEMDIAGRLSILKSEFMNLPYQCCQELNRILEGNPEKITDAIQFLLGLFAERLDHFSQNRRYRVKLDLDLLDEESDASPVIGDPEEIELG